MHFLQFPFRPGVILYLHASSWGVNSKVPSDDDRSHFNNFMTEWDERTRICVFSEDGMLPTRHEDLERFMVSSWFTYGWCFRELVRQKSVDFYSADWTNHDSRWSLRDVTYRTTLIAPSPDVSTTDIASLKCVLP